MSESKEGSVLPSSSNSMTSEDKSNIFGIYGYPKAVKIQHIHRSSDRQHNFIEFVMCKNGKQHLLKEDGFIARFGSRLISDFES